MKSFCFAFAILLAHFNASSAVILQYHHVNEHTPKSTSISPQQFQKHLEYLADNDFHVIALSRLVDAIKNQESLPDKAVAITFDDAYLDILEQAKPLLDKFNYPYTIFVNPAIVNRQSPQYLSWQQLKSLADDDVIIANHGLEHNSLARVPDGTSEQQWLKQQGERLLAAEKIIEQHVGQSWRFFAYPYGEFTLQTQQWIKDHNFVAFGQQSGAVGSHTDLTSIPRFPASQPYDQLAALKDKLNSLPFNITIAQNDAQTLFSHGQVKSVSFEIDSSDFHQRQLNCYVSGLGKQKIDWHDQENFSLYFTEDLPSGRVRANCTAPSIEKPGRYYWFSKPWFILKPNGEWYAL